jgi:hypothetical protein
MGSLEQRAGDCSRLKLQNDAAPNNKKNAKMTKYDIHKLEKANKYIQYRLGAEKKNKLIARERGTTNLIPIEENIAAAEFIIKILKLAKLEELPQQQQLFKQ